MAIYTTNVLADNSPTTVGTGSFSTAGPSSVLGMDPMSITLVDPAVGYAVYLGSFSYTYSGGYQYLSWPGSTLTGITTYDLNWTVMDSISGLNIPGSTYESYALNNDVVGLVAYFLAGNDTITGSSFNDVLWCYAGNDTVNGGAGADTLVGGTGDDTYVVDDAGDAVTENFNEGSDTVQSSVGYTLGANIENMTLTGTAAVNGTGNALDNVFFGNDAANLLDGGLGSDSMSGGLGDDIYAVDAQGDSVVELAEQGIDTVQSAITYTLGANVENLTLTGTAIDGTGNALDNILTGNAADNILNGGDGNDTLIGGAGNDTLIGGFGVDSFFGGAGDDTYFAAIGNGLDTIADFSVGDNIRVIGASLSGAVAAGDGTAVLSNQVQYVSAGGTTTLFIGTDAVAGADVQVQLAGTFSAGDFALFGDQVFFNAAPTGYVTIGGTPYVGYTLTASNTLSDADGLGTIGYQWQADGIDIAGATGSTYVLTPAELDKTVSVVASYADGHGMVESVVGNGLKISLPPTSRYTLQGSGANFIDFHLPYGELSLDGQNILFKGSAGVDSAYVGSAVLTFDFTQAGLGVDQLYLSGNWADYSCSYSGSVVTLVRTNGGSEKIKAISGDSLIFADGTVAVADALNFLKGTAAEPIPGGAASGVFPMAVSVPLNNVVRAVVLDATGETLALARPGVAMLAKGGSGADIAYVAQGANADVTQFGLGQDKLYLTGCWMDYAGSYSGSVITLTRAVGAEIETVRFLGGSASAWDNIVFADGTARSVDILNYLKAPPTALQLVLDTVEVTPLGTGAVVAGTSATETLSGSAAGDVIYGNGGADLIDGGAGADQIVVADADATAAGSATVRISTLADGTDTVVGFSAGLVAGGGDVLDLSSIANLVDAVETGQTLSTDFTASNVFVFDATPVAIVDAAMAIAADISVVATNGYIVIADAAKANVATVYHSTDLAADGVETALVVLSGVDITQLTMSNFLV